MNIRIGITKKKLHFQIYQNTISTSIEHWAVVFHLQILAFHYSLIENQWCDQ